MAVQALTRAESAHARLDGYNGQLRRLGDEQRSMREELWQGITAVREDHQATREQVVAIKNRTAVYAAIGAFVASAVMAPLAVIFTVKAVSPEHPSQAGVANRPSIAAQAPTQRNGRGTAPVAAAGEPRAHTGTSAGNPTHGSHNQTPTLPPNEPPSQSGDLLDQVTDLLSSPTLEPQVAPILAVP